MALTADMKLVGDEILIVRISSDATQEEADRLAEEIEEIVSRHGSGFAVVVAGGDVRAEKCPFVPVPPQPVDLSILGNVSLPAPRRWQYPVC